MTSPRRRAVVKTLTARRTGGTAVVLSSRIDTCLVERKREREREEGEGQAEELDGS